MMGAPRFSEQGFRGPAYHYVGPGMQGLGCVQEAPRWCGAAGSEKVPATVQRSTEGSGSPGWALGPPASRDTSLVGPLTPTPTPPAHCLGKGNHDSGVD